MFIALFLFMLIFSSVAYAQNDILIIQPGSTGIDAYIREYFPNTNYDSDTLYVGRDGNDKALRALIWFNMSAIPYGATIHNASLELYEYTGGSVNSLPTSVYKLTQAWTENAVTWNNYNVSGSWATAGGDYSSLQATVNLTSIDWYSWNVTPAVQAWAAGGPNYGFILLANLSEYKGVSSSDYADSGYRPKLIINYTPNQPPWFNLSDNSNSTSPTNVGLPVIFSAAWADSDSAQARMYLCNSSSITSSGCGDSTLCSTSNATTNPATCSYTSQASDYFVSYWAMLCDDENNCSAVQQGNFTVNHAPYVLVTAPNGNETINQANGSYAIRFNASDPDGNNLTASLYYSIAAGTRQNVINASINLSSYCYDPDSNTTTTNNCTYFWNSSGIGGIYYLDIEVNDSWAVAMNSSNSTFAVESIVDVWAPNITSESITSGLTSGMAANISANVSDPNIQSAWFQINKSGLLRNYSMSLASGWYVGAWEAEETGSYSYKVYARDTLGNFNNTRPWIGFDVSKPSASTANWENPAKALPNSVVKISLNVSSGSLRDVWAIFNSNGPFGFQHDYPQNLSVGNVSGTSRALWFLSVPGSDGSYTFNMTFGDKYGNQWNSSSSQSMQVTSALGSGSLELSADIVGGTEYETGELGEISIFLKNTTGGYVENASCTVELYNTSHALKSTASATQLGKGVYFYSFITGEEGIHTAWAECSYGSSTAYAAHTFHVAPWSGKIGYIYNATLAAGGSIVDFGTLPSNLSTGTPSIIWIKAYSTANATQNFRIRTEIKYSTTTKYSVSDIVSLAPGNSTFNMSQSWSPDVAGMHSITATLMSSDATKIYDTHTTTFIIPGTLVYDVDVACLKPELAAGEYADANITIWNLGDYYQDVQVAWWVESEGGARISEASLPLAVYPNDRRTLTKSLFMPSNSTTGKYYYKASVAFGDGNQSTGFCAFYVISPTTTTTIQAGGGGGGAVTTPETLATTTTTLAPYLLSFVTPLDTIYLSEGIEKNITIVVENIGKKDVHNISIYIDGIPAMWHNVTPDAIGIMKPGGRQIFTVTFSVPEAKGGMRQIKYMLQSAELKLEKPGIISVESRASALLKEVEALEAKAKDIKYTIEYAGKQGMYVSEAQALLNMLQQKIEDAKSLIGSGRLEEAEKAIEKIKEYISDITKRLERLGIAVREKPAIETIWIVTWVLLAAVAAAFIMLYRKLRVMERERHLGDSGLTEFERKLRNLKKKLEGGK